jgi:subtilisin family serine protease
VDKSKIAPNLLTVLEQPPSFDVEAIGVPVIIRYRQDAIRSRSVQEGIQATYVYKLTPTVAAMMPTAAVFSLSDQQDIEFIWLDEEIHTCLDRSAPAIGVPAVWADGYRGAGIRVAIVDTGVDRAHPDFSGRALSAAISRTTMGTAHTWPVSQPERVPPRRIDTSASRQRPACTWPRCSIAAGRAR